MPQVLLGLFAPHLEALLLSVPCSAGIQGTCQGALGFYQPREDPVIGLQSEFSRIIKVDNELVGHIKQVEVEVMTDKLHLLRILLDLRSRPD